jgi:small-conductance mechanosensitive channel
VANHTNVTTPPVVGASLWTEILDFLARGTAILEFLAIVVGALLLGRGLRWIYVKSQRGRPTSAQLLASKGIMLFIVFVGAWLGIRVVFGANPANMVATLGIVSLALGFGLQNTVANLAAGVSLSLDKPFDVGDRIKVGQTWGDVVTIGFRSTTILTTAGERVVIPNAILDTQEVWNYSGQQGELRVEIPLQISYKSSVELADEIALRIARDTDHVLAYPEPRLMVRALGSDGIDLELRCWLAQPNEKAKVVNSILRRVKRKFDEEGVHIPFPQRTLNYLKDDPEPAATPEHLLGVDAHKPVIVALIRSPLTSAKTPSFVAAFAKGVGARLVFLHVRPPSSSLQPAQGQQALNKCLAAARLAGLSASGRMEVGQLADVVAQIVRQEGAKILVLVRNQNRGVRGWGQSEQQAIQSAVSVPVQLLEPDTPPVEKAINHWHEKLHEEIETTQP